MPRKKKTDETEESKPARKIIYMKENPPAYIRTYGVKVDLPPAEEQLAGFEVGEGYPISEKQAEKIVKRVPGFKWLLPKGTKR